MESPFIKIIDRVQYTRFLPLPPLSPFSTTIRITYNGTLPMGVLTINSFWNSTFLSWNLFINERERERERRSLRPPLTLLSVLFLDLSKTAAFSSCLCFKHKRTIPGILGIARTSDVIARMYPVKIVEFKNGTRVFYTHSER